MRRCNYFKYITFHLDFGSFVSDKVRVEEQTYCKQHVPYIRFAGAKVTLFAPSGVRVKFSEYNITLLFKIVLDDAGYVLLRAVSLQCSVVLSNNYERLLLSHHIIGL